ncbi:RNA polymerase-associated protein RapA [Alcanivorax sp. DP30]|uniref:RNA polymerase-associated protein RapA n=1 Tax=Alcanivorax sp. DP30 TaxID=2606217 RepID=UPI00137089DF|nr:RNA polymerase-associated protein RapA [Alcanivorax sp. DP30]MZR63755.1 RNA polymerase-associated protein RapA [Alcanivorax sp. DP30]
MSDFTPGQRWLSESETELGLGIIKELDYRLVTVEYPAVEEERTYAINNAPLSRVTFNTGDTIRTEGELELTVAEVNELNGLKVYMAHPAGEPENVQPVPETLLGHTLRLNSALDRLLSNQLSSNRWFELRVDALNAHCQQQQSRIKGLRGPRIDHIGHQLYIADQVANRYAPRVLLADEVGLGKTIEAGLILHQQLLTGRARRVLVVVPPALVHQWFVEMVRRFNLHFSIFDSERLNAIQPETSIKDMLAQIIEEERIAEEKGETPDNQDNPFLSEQLVLCSTEFLAECNIEELAAADWDLLVVDEAHHLEWSEESPSDSYQRVETVARQARGLLLLTATPEQLGLESHFARLRLLDPDRYPSLAAFREEQSHYQEIAQLAGDLHDQKSWNASLVERAQALLPDMTISDADRDAVLAELLDRSGPGRVMFRNTRHNIAGFPQRHAHGYPQELPEEYRYDSDESLEGQLHPETLYHDDRWCTLDPRVTWLEQFFKQHRQEKVLVICASRHTATDLHAHCNYKLGMNVAMFHEDMDLIERDRAAAFFADDFDGAQALICSEIGSEGRNFQFAHHLVLLDLPLNPDLLEQRIGRLDRIGQREDIQIHVPYFEGHAQEVLFRWYHEGMNAFEHTNPAGHDIYLRSRDALETLLCSDPEYTAIDALVDETRTIADELHTLMETGRDRLLELSSFDDARAEQLKASLAESDEESPLPFMQRVFDRYGVDQEDHSDTAIILKPGPHMRDAFPGLPDEGITMTDDRATALSRDDMQFMTWEHPMVTGSMEMLLGEHRGKAAVSLLKNPRIKAGTLLIEAIYTVESMAPRHLQADRFLPCTVIRHLLDANGKNISQAISHDGLSQQCHKMDKPLSRKIVSSQKDLLEKLLKANDAAAAQEAEGIIASALDAMRQEQGHELARLKALKAKNPAVREEEITAMEEQTAQLEKLLTNAQCQLNAVRIIVAGGE